MTWPTVAITTTNLDAGTDSPAAARTDLLDAVTKTNQMIAHVSTFAATVLDDTTAAASRTTLGAAASGANTDITSLSAPALGAGTATTAAVNTNTTQVATTAFVVAQASAVAGAALGTAAVGTSLRYARADHVHASATATSPLTNYFQSAQQTITSAGALTIAHGLGSKPTLVIPFLICTTADAGYSVNDELLMSGGDNGNNRSSSFVCDANYINVRFSSVASSFAAANKADGVTQALVNASWKLIVRVWT